MCSAQCPLAHGEVGSTGALGGGKIENANGGGEGGLVSCESMRERNGAGLYRLLRRGALSLSRARARWRSATARDGGMKDSQKAAVHSACPRCDGMPPVPATTPLAAGATRTEEGTCADSEYTPFKFDARARLVPLAVVQSGRDSDSDLPRWLQAAGSQRRQAAAAAAVAVHGQPLQRRH